ncbi:Teichoic acid translocation permease protein TagG [Vibrio thalassae]|uniref:Transport permease protein n=1 Tax=Vibrio thalassae TaxID=1243014 RepID=A0A240EP52_9VIBR|nr:ABC transporter permease [Vibrio thalassae]SNX49760.1 Teichoic acid translocation permease protein TagG [Vibrio thalassae]
MQEFPISIKSIASSFIANRNLIITSIKREIVGRYKGSLLGILWSFVNPIFMLLVYTFVFSVVFKAKWGDGGGESKAEFALILFCGLIVFNIFSEAISKAPTSILINPNYVKKVVYPLEALAWVNTGSSLFHGIVSFLVWMLAYIALYGIPSATILLVPIVILPLLLMVQGLTWFLSAIGTYIRDVNQLVSILITTMLFMSPIFYPISALPEIYQKILYLNPLTIIIEQVRAVAFYGEFPNYKLVIGYTFCSSIVCYVGYFCFQKSRKGFSDVL